jgi:hypothetical protein
LQTEIHELKEGRVDTDLAEDVEVDEEEALLGQLSVCLRRPETSTLSISSQSYDRELQRCKNLQRNK